MVWPAGLLASLYAKDFRWPRCALRRIARIWPLWLAFLVFSVCESALLQTGAWHGLPTYTAGPRISPLAAFLLTAFFVGGWINGNLWIVVPGGWSIYCEMAHYTSSRGCAV